MHSIAWWPTLIVLAVATYTDLRSRRIPNWLVLPFLVAGLRFRLDARVAWEWSRALLGLGLGALLFGILA